MFVVRHQYHRDHHNTATMFQTGEINTSGKRPAANPRPDMPSFEPANPTELEQQVKYELQVVQEAQMRRAIIEGAKLFGRRAPK